MTADIGDYAKSRYGTRSGYVCKSVKSLMGTSDQVPLVDEIPDKTPSAFRIIPDIGSHFFVTVLVIEYNGGKKGIS